MRKCRVQTYVVVNIASSAHKKSDTVNHLKFLVLRYFLSYLGPSVKTTIDYKKSIWVQPKMIWYNLLITSINVLKLLWSDFCFVVLHRILAWRLCILGTLYPFFRCGIFAYELDAANFRYFVLNLPNAEFLHFNWMQSRIDFRYFVLNLPNAEFLHLSLMQSNFDMLYSIYQCRIFASYI